MKKISAPAASVNALCHCLVVTVYPVSASGPLTATLECALGIPATLLELLPHMTRVALHHISTKITLSCTLSEYLHYLMVT